MLISVSFDIFEKVFDRADFQTPFLTEFEACISPHHTGLSSFCPSFYFFTILD